MVFSGDFRQTLPIVLHGNRAAIVSQCLNRSYLWRHFEIIKLTKNMRIHIDDSNIDDKKEFEKYILNVGNGNIPLIDDTNKIELPNELCLKGDNINDLISNVFNDIQTNYTKDNYFTDRAILCTKNNTVHSVNKLILDKLPEDEITYFSRDSSTFDETNAIYPIEFLNSYQTTSLPQHELTLKKNSIIMLTRNINIQEGLCNGTKLIITNLKPHVVEGKVLTGKNINTKVFIPRILFTTKPDVDAIMMQRQQFPIRLAFSITINKAQGQTLKKIGLFVDSPLFAHGHLYTVLSRVSDKNSIKILIKEETINSKKGFFINNIVYTEVLTK